MYGHDVSPFLPLQWGLQFAKTLQDLKYHPRNVLHGLFLSTSFQIHP
jgi:hypothetical protein